MTAAEIHALAHALAPLVAQELIQARLTPQPAAAADYAPGSYLARRQAALDELAAKQIKKIRRSA